MNRLAGASSPYLRQHADNPVDWLPWGEEAFALARREDRPLFVSIGYASCHWCHVMAHESFEDPATAEDLARWFVSVKVDREERPDVDAVYMAAVQAISGSGGWPMSVFCTPDGRPFFAGTYFPPGERHGMPAFRRVLAAMAEAWRERREEVETQADALVAAVARDACLADTLGPGGAPGAPATFSERLAAAVAQLSEGFDADWGGFGPAPKFPRPTLVELCLHHHLATGDRSSATMATTTLDAMAAGGIYDHLAGGFCRYSTDRQWLVPHFEKMLTDQALLSRAYIRAWQVTAEPRYLQVATETLDYVLDELSSPGGGLCSSQDADAGGVEGSHATFTPDQVRSALEGRPDLVEPVLDWYGITPAGNWEGTAILRRPTGAPLGRPAPIEEGRRLLLAARRRRPQPARDTKVLTEWNAMAGAALAEAAASTGNARWAERAEALGEFLFSRLRRPDGRWLRSLGGEQPAFAGDFAWVVECCTRLGELTGRARWTDRAAETADAMLSLFWDEERGGVFTTGSDAERLIVRGKEVLDGALPSANATAAGALLRLAAITGDDGHRRAGVRIVETAASLLDGHATAVADMLAASALVGGGTQVLVAGERPDLLEVVRARWIPDGVLAWGEPTPSPLWSGRRPGAAYVCRRFACQVPAGDPGTLAAQLKAAQVEAAQVEAAQFEAAQVEAARVEPPSPGGPGG